MHKKIKGGRNVVNSKEILQSLRLRAEKRNLSEPVKLWLSKQFYSWLINSFAHARKVANEKAFTSLTGKAAPEWFISRFKEKGQTFWYIDIEHPELIQIETKLIEWLEIRSNTSEARKFPRMTPSQILVKWQEDHRRIQKKQELGLLPTSGNALVKVIESDGLIAFEFNPEHPEFRIELFNETLMMQHCIGEFESRESLQGGYGEYYANAAENGQLRLLTVRNKNSKSHVSISLLKNEKGNWTVEQIKGKQNKPPVIKYIPIVQQLLNKLEVVHLNDSDCLEMGLFYENGHTVNISEISDKKQVMKHVFLRPELISMLPDQDPAMQWIALLRSPSLANKLVNPTLAMQLSSWMLDPLIAEEAESCSKAQELVVNGRMLHLDHQSFALPPLYLGKN